jgi:hypothetical protein
MSIQPTAVRAISETRPAKQRSQVTNGKRMFVDGNGRSPWARRWRDLCELHAWDLCGGDLNSLSEAKRSLIKRAATIEIELEAIEGKLSTGKEADLSTYAMAAGHLKRILETLGLDRVARDVTFNDLLRADVKRQQQQARGQQP